MRWMIKPVVESLPEAIVDLTEETLIRVLHVDDDADFLNTAKQILEMQSSFQVETARSVEEAKDKMKEKTFDVIVSDYVMPGKNGLDFLKELGDSGSNIPFILLTGKGREEVAIKALNLGVDGYFNKLGHPETVYGELAHGIRCTVKSKQAEQALKESEEKYHSLFANMLNGFAYCQMIFDEKDKPIDFVYLEVNDAFEKLTGLKKEDVIGKKVTEAIPGTEKANPELFDIYSRVALTGKEEEFEIFFKPLNMWLSISVYSPKKGYFVAVFENITERKKAEETLRASEEKHRVISSITADLVFSCIRSDERGFTVDWMAGAAEKIFGYSTKEINKKGCWKFTVQPQDLPIFDEKVTGLKPGQSSICELRITHKDGSLKWIKVLARVVIDSSNPTNYRLFGACRDVTERKKAEEKLNKLKAFDERIIDSLGEALLIIDPDDYRIINVNKEALEQLNLRRDDLIGKTCYEAIHHRSTPCQAPEHICPIRKMLETGSPATVEHTHFDHQNNAVNVEVSAYPVTDPEGKTAVIHVAKNITERKLMEQAVRDSEEKFRTISNSTKDALLLVDGDGRIVFWNPSAEKTFGYTREEAMDKEIHMLVSPRARVEVRKVIELGLKEFAETGRTAFIGETVELTARRKDGTEFPIKLSLSAMLLKGKWHAVALARDITEQKRVREQLKNYSEELEKTVAVRTRELKEAHKRLLTAERFAAIGELAGIVGHDLRNPLTGIKNAAYYLKKRDAYTDGDGRGMIEVIEKAIEHANGIINDLLDYSREMHLSLRNARLSP